jgi:hypothetical protein
MTEPHAIWQDVRALADELELQIHLAGMEARDAWRTLKPRVANLEQTLERSREQVGDVLSRELSDVRGALLRLREQLNGRPRTDVTNRS